MKDVINIKRIEHFIKKQNLSKTQFCKLCKISPSTFRKVMSNNHKFRISALFKIARTMNMEISEIFD